MTASLGDAPDTGVAGPWNPGIQSRVPNELRHLASIFRPENVATSIAAADELHGLTGISPYELVAFRPQRLALHEVLIRVTADFRVPDGSRIGDLGINFREIAGRLLEQHVIPQMPAIAAAFEQARRGVQEVAQAAVAGLSAQTAPAPSTARTPASRLFARVTARRAARVLPNRSWGPREIEGVERMADVSTDEPRRIVLQTLARVMSALFSTHGFAWGTPELIVSLTTDIAGNALCSDAIGRVIEPILRCAAATEGYALLPRQEQPVVINTKGASASGKSTLRPLQKRLAGDIGVAWNEFALISPDIWRKQLLDYGALGAAYKYAGAFTAEELQIVDQKLDRYMARKHARGDMSHLLIDRFRFDSFAPDSDQAGSNLLTRFGQTAYLFFVITPPEQLVERAWKRGLEFGRYKAVDDTLAHAVQAYTGIPDVFFTWVRRSDKRIRFEFLDNTVPLGERPRTVAFGDNETFNVLDVTGTLNIERYGRLDVDAAAPEYLYPNPELLAAVHNVGFLRRCVETFREVNFADQRSGRLYLSLRDGAPVLTDRDALEAALTDGDTLAGVQAVAPGALSGAVATADQPRYLHGEHEVRPFPTLGQWGS